LRILRIYLWKIRTDWLDELKLKLVVASNINPFTTSLFLMRMSLSPSTNFPTPTQYQKDFAAWDLYQAPYMDTPCHLMIYDFRQNLNSTGGTWLHPRAPRSCRCITFSLAKWRSSIEALHWQRSGTFFCGDCLFVFFFVCLRLSIKILQNGFFGGILRLNRVSSIFSWHRNRCSVCICWRRQYWKVLKPANILMCLVDGQITQRICCLVSSTLKASPKKCHLTKESLLSRYGEKLLISVTRMTCCGIQRCTDALFSSRSNHKKKSLTQEEELYQHFKIFQHI